MIEVQHHINIDRSPEDVFAALADLEGWPAWQRSVLDVRRTTSGPLRAGSEFEQTARVMGRTRQVAARVAAHRPSELIAFSGRAPMGDFYCAFELSSDDRGGTSLVSRYELSPRGLWKLMRPMIAREFQRETAGEIGGLKRVLEGRVSEPRGA